MPESIKIVKGRHGGASLCERCAEGTRLSDSKKEFYECREHLAQPTLRHRRDKDGQVRLSPHIRWDDETPEYPALNASAVAGCELCLLIREALVQCEVQRRAQVSISCCYIWGADSEYGLAYMLCEVFSAGERISYIKFPISAANDVRSWLRTLDPIYQDPLDPENIDWLKDELIYCDRECEHPTPPTEFVPTRLIDVGEGENGRARLIMTTSLIDGESRAPVKYAALSYCWGPKKDADHQLKTTWWNQDSFRQEIPEGKLTPVIRDTLRVCRALCIRYVWIDALCIVQGCIDDWSRESEAMGLVYYHSYLTICPLSSHSCLQGFLLPRPGVKIGFQSSINSHVCGNFTLHKGYSGVEHWVADPPARDWEISTWRTRGWTLQENSFSRRFLYFGESMIKFECDNAAACENGHVIYGPGLTTKLGELKDLSLFSNRSKRSKNRALNVWTQYMYTIHQRKFTCESDLLPSLSGLARACSEVLEDTYLAGIWKRYIHFGLLWALKGPPPGNLDAKLEALRHPNPYIAPSWSWASHKEYFECFSPWTATDRPAHIRSHLTVVDYQVDLESQENPYGRIKSAALLLRGRMVPPPSDIKMRPFEHKDAMGHLADKRGTVMFDWVVTERTVQKRDGLEMLLTTSCCQATSNETSEFFTDPDEDHTTTFIKTHRIRGQCESKDDDYDEDEEDEKNDDDDDDDDVDAATTCLSCLDETSPPNCFGLMLYPADSPGAYVRVGVFVLFGGTGGMDIFQDVAEREVEIL